VAYRRGPLVKASNGASGHRAQSDCLPFSGAKAPAFRHGEEATLLYQVIRVMIVPPLAACERRFSAVLKVQASISLQGKPAESARKTVALGQQGVGCKAREAPGFSRGELSPRPPVQPARENMDFTHETPSS
jgi:hypothetical protein